MVSTTTSPAPSSPSAGALGATPSPSAAFWDAPSRVAPCPSPLARFAYDVAAGALGLDPEWHAPWSGRRYAHALWLSCALLVEVEGLSPAEAAAAIGRGTGAAARYLRAHHALLAEDGPLREAYEDAWRDAAGAFASVSEEARRRLVEAPLLDGPPTSDA